MSDFDPVAAAAQLRQAIIDDAPKLFAENQRLTALLETANTYGAGENKARIAAEAEVERLRAEVATLREVGETKVHGIHIGSDGLYMGLSGGAAMVMAEMLAEQYKQGGGINYIEMRFESKESMPGQRFLVTVKRADGKTPHELRVEAEAERDRLRAEVASAKRAIAIAQAFNEFHVPGAEWIMRRADELLAGK